MSHRPRSRGCRHTGGGCPGPARGRSAAPGRSRLPGRREGRRKGSDCPRPGPSAHLPQARKGPRPSEAPPTELPAGSGAAPGKRATQGGEGTEGEAGQEEEPRNSTVAATARPSSTRALRAPGGEGREPSAMATAGARGEAEQPPPLRVATTLGAGNDGERGGAEPRPLPSRSQAWSSTGRRTAPLPNGRARVGVPGSCSLEMCAASLSISLGILYIETAVLHLTQHCLQSDLCRSKMLTDNCCYMNLLYVSGNSLSILLFTYKLTIFCN